jgi:hypothetical protein
MTLNTRDRNIDSSKREDSRIGYVDRCEVINVHPHVQPYPTDKDFNTVDVMVINRPPSTGSKNIKFVKLNCIQHFHGKFQGQPWHPRIGDMIFIYWLAKREALVLGSCISVEQEPVCRSLANQNHQEYVFKLSPWEEPSKNRAVDGNYVDFPPPKHPTCFKWWPVKADGVSLNLDTIQIWDCLEGHNCANCGADAPCNGLDDHQSSTCFKNFSQFSPTLLDKVYRFKFLHHCGSYWYFDDDAVWRIAGKKNSAELGFIHHYTDGKIEINSPVEILIKAPLITLDSDVIITGDLSIEGNNAIAGACAHGSCSCMGGGAGGTSGTCTGTGQANQAVAHGMTDNLGTACSPSSITPTCRGSGSCVVTGCDDTNFYCTITLNEIVDWQCSAPKDGWGDWAPCF